MATSIRQFNAGLFAEHLEEASFLYVQRCAYLHDPELRWTDLAAYEARFEAHIDALVVGEEPALQVCKERCAGGEAGELHAALRVFCRQDRPDLAFAVLQGLDYEDGNVTQAAVDALKAECPEAWHDDLLRIMLGRSKALVPILAAALAYRRVPIEATLLRVLGDCPENQVAPALWALGRIGTVTATAVLGKHLRSESAVVAEAACRSLIRLGDYHAVRHGLLVAQLKPWPVLAIGIGGNRTAVNVLTELAKSDAVTAEVLLALGLLGDLASVSTIFKCLTNAKCATAAAIALQAITGAALYEDVFVPDDVDPDELFDEERKKYEQTGQVPTRPNGEPFGATITQIAINPETWRGWLTEHKGRFDPQFRYRHGSPYSPAALLQCLRAEHTPNRIRDLACDELVVRYAAPLTLEIDMPVRQQQARLAEIEAWVQQNQAKFQPGLWYFAGRPLE